MTNNIAEPSAMAGLILAAGAARRMGRDKRALRVGGRTLLGHALAAAADGGLAPLLLVTGPEGPPPPAGIAWVVNPAPGRGLASSLAAGLAALPAGLDAVMVLLADMPKVGGAHVARLRHGTPPGRIGVPRFGGRRGNPVVLPAALFPEVAALDGDVGARPLIERHPDLVTWVEMPDDAVLVDLDTPEDLAALTEEAGRC